MLPWNTLQVHKPKKYIDSLIDEWYVVQVLDLLLIASHPFVFSEGVGSGGGSGSKRTSYHVFEMITEKSYNRGTPAAIVDWGKKIRVWGRI